MKKEVLLLLILLLAVWFFLEAGYLGTFGGPGEKPSLSPSQEDMDGACVSLCEECVIYEESDLPVRFLGRIARAGRTGFTDLNSYGGVVDSPGVGGSDNPGIFYDRGKLYVIFGDPNLLGGGCSIPNSQLSGAMAFTEEIAPQKGLSFEHYKNWITKEINSPEWDCDGNGFPDAKALSESVSEGGHLYYRPNSAGGVVLDLPNGGQRIVFMTYFRESSASDENRVQMLYTDDNFETFAVQDPDLILWDKYDAGNGPYVPNTYLGYSMRKYRDYVYILFPKHYGRIALLRIYLDDLVKGEMSLEDWEYFVSVNEITGESIWNKGIARGQISYDASEETYIPEIDFDPDPSTIASVIWNPYLNRWLASDITKTYLWGAENYWGPYELIGDVETPGSNNRFMHETLLGGNGREVYYAAAQYPSQQYGSYFYAADFDEPFDIFLSQKSAVEGDVLEMVVADNSGGGQIDAFVDGNPAEFVSSEGNEHLFSYTLSGDENSGEEGVVKVLATNGTYSRDVALVVNRINGIEMNITSHSDDDEVSGTILLDVDAHYEQEPLDLGEGKPEVYIIKTELSSECGFVEDADTYEPYSLKLDTTRFSDGAHYFKVTAYDTLDRRAEKIIRLNVNNPDRSPVEGNLVVDGDMEAENVSAWEEYNGAIVKKVNGVQKGDVLSLLVVNNYEIDNPKGVEQTISGLNGGENLRLEAWIKIISYVFDGNVLDSKASVSVLDENGETISYGEINPYGFFRRFTHEFVNPEENKNLTIVFSVKEPNIGGAEKVEVLIDDVVLVNDSIPLVDPPDGISVMSKNGKNLIAWDKPESVNADYFYVYKKNSSEGDYERVQELKSYRQSYLDGPGDFEENVSYYVTLVDFMGSESLPSELVSCPGNCSICGDGACEGIEDELNCPEDCFLPANDEELGTDGDNNNQGSDVDLLKECNDGIDNDADGFVDYPEDLGCNNLTDDSELEFGVTSANCTPLFECENWGDCIDGGTTRECYDTKNCGSEKYNETEECDLSDAPGGDTGSIKIFVGAVVAIAIGAAGLILRYWNRSKKKEYPVSTLL